MKVFALWRERYFVTVMGGGDVLECIATNDLSVIKVTQRSEMKEINGYKEGARGKVCQNYEVQL